MKKVINVAVCDARELNEESLSGLEEIVINAALMVTSTRAREIMSRYPFTLSVAATVDLPEDQKIDMQTVNGKGTIGPDSEGSGVFLVVNGKLMIEDGSAEAVKSYLKIMVNGKVMMPRSYQGRFTNITVNGKTEYYPDGAFLLKGDTEIDDLFLMRANHALYYCPGDLFFLDPSLDTEMIHRLGLSFTGRRVVICESLLGKLLAQFDEETEIIRLPDGTKRIDKNIKLTNRIMERYGTRLYVSGDVVIEEAEALAKLEYLYADGNVSVTKELEDAFLKKESIYEELKVLDPDRGCLSDRPSVKIGPALLQKYPNGVRVEDCVKVTVEETLSPDDILEKIEISDCVIVVCTEEQEDAVNMIAKDVVMVKTYGQEAEDDDEENGEDSRPGGLLGKMKDSQVINAVEYKM